MLRLLLRWAVLAVAIWLATAVVPGVTVSGGWGTYLWVALLFGLINAVIGPVLKLLALPLTILTLGLFALVVNAALLGLTAKITERLDIDGFWSAVFGALVISLVSMALNRLVRDVTED